MRLQTCDIYMTHIFGLIFAKTADLMVDSWTCNAFVHFLGIIWCLDVPFTPLQSFMDLEVGEYAYHVWEYIFFILTRLPGIFMVYLSHFSLPGAIEMRMWSSHPLCKCQTISCICITYTEAKIVYTVFYRTKKN